MTGLDLLVRSAAGAAAVLLLLAGVGHLRHRRLFAATLAAQKTLPAGVQQVVARVMGPLETLLGAVLVIGLLVGGPASTIAAVGAGLLYLAFGTYVAVVWRTRPSVPCGCFASSGPVSGWTVLRAALLGIACLALPLVPGHADPLLVTAGTLVLTGVFWLLPELTHIVTPPAQP